MPGTKQSDLTETKRRILTFFDRTNFDYLEAITVVYNLDVPEDEAQAALEALEQEGELKPFEGPESTVYKRIRE